MRFQSVRQTVIVLALFALIGAACSSGPDETAGQLLAVEQQLADVTAERDVLKAQIDQPGNRNEKTSAVKAAVRDTLDNPDAYGTEEEVVELLATYATPDAIMQDDAFDAAMNMRDSWYNTLYQSSMDAEIEVLHQWVSDDGSQSSGLWVWKGKNINGLDFELIGVNVDTHNEEGLITHELILYPYPDEYVTNAALGTGTSTGSDVGTPAGGSSDDVFAFGVDDLCEWISLDEMAGIVVDAYRPSGIDPFPEQADSREVQRVIGDEGQPGCQWFLDGPDSSVWVIEMPMDQVPAEFAAHALLDDGVGLSIQTLGTIVFYVAERDAAIAFSHAGPEAGAGLDDLSEEVRIANEILKTMNWV